MPPAPHVSKFGGTSVATPERIRRAVALVADAPKAGRPVVVVSALGGTTDDLLAALDAALARSGHGARVATIRQRHHAAADALATPADRADLGRALDTRLAELTELLDGVSLLREATARTRDAVLATGERLSAPLVAAAFRAAGHPAAALDAAALIRTDARFGGASVDFEATRALARDALGALPADAVAVVTGFIGSTEGGVTTTLGRSGSDYTATILAEALGASACTIWTDVAGVYTADPRLVPEATPLARLSYREAAELAYFGANVLHPRTMLPAERAGIPLLIKSTLEPDAPGTVISAETDALDLRVKALSAVRDQAVVTVEGGGLQSVVGVSARLFAALSDAGVNVRMISQASSEQSVCVVVDGADAPASVTALRAAFETEIARGDVRAVEAIADCAVVSAVGEGMRHQPGLAGRLFATLGRAGVNVLAIAQGAAETNISLVVRQPDVGAALGALHEAFPLRRSRVHVVVIGTGTVGRRLVEMMAEHAPMLLERDRIHLRLVGLANSRTMRWDAGGLPLADALDTLADGEPADLDALDDRLLAGGLERRIVVDATASEAIARRYVRWLEGGVGVVTPNKKANTLDLGYYRRLREAAGRREVSYHYETTVMAGLPVVFTVRDLLRSGDRIDAIEGVFSGTLAFLFNKLAEGASFSDAVREAKARGLTEPDPRDDLTGEDVARKLLILARETGCEVERADLAVESLVPVSLADVSVDAFLDALDGLDADWAARAAAAEAEGKRLAYIGQITDDGLSVGVRAVDTASPFGGSRGTDNVILIQSARYHDTPLVVQGPGAGPDVTAAGLLADLVKAAELMP
ncbi:bifunctional aspartate kinase/homoserine dehydrogenase I [Rubrivirga sp. IMCC45206]|uniref:bifunctional aspartate kinase/homoserine dehydrogenase I n=1 Tax=Rubrivirga sp. IMCC45206 TaxID=3391614 RepID=UPI0039901CCB